MSEQNQIQVMPKNELNRLIADLEKIAVWKEWSPAFLVIREGLLYRLEPISKSKPVYPAKIAPPTTTGCHLRAPMVSGLPTIG